MAREIWKDVMYEGAVPTVDGDRYTITSADLDRAVDNGNKLVQKLYQVPGYWEHQRTAGGSYGGPTKPGTDVDTHIAKNTIGRVKRFRRVDGGPVEALFEIDDDKDAEQLPKTRFVSPYAEWDWTDGDGERYSGPTILHIAATARPIQRGQRPFALSHQSCRTARAVRLSLSDYEAPMADEKDDKKPKESDGEGKKGEGEKDHFKEAMDHLAGHGITLPEDTTPENAWERICIACEAIEGAKNKMSEDDEDDEEPSAPGPQDKPVETTQPPPIAMSEAERKQNQRAEERARKNLIADIDALGRSGRVTPKIASGLRQRALAVRLSFTAAGDVAPNDLTTEVAAYEKLPAAHAWSRRSKKVKLSERPGGEITRSGPGDIEDDAGFEKKWEETLGRPQKKN